MKAELEKYLERAKRCNTCYGPEDVPRLIAALECAIEQRNELKKFITWKTGGGYEIESLNAELSRILEGK